MDHLWFGSIWFGMVWCYSSILQSRYPRISRDTLLPLARSFSQGGQGGQEAWYPPGHGDFYQAFASSGLLDTYLGQGR